ncbi:MAG: hypothetical protein IMW98_09635, partial [Firmicutes bacterium]|nr:hypothetical protein [Bacillota bacterium]
MGGVQGDERGGVPHCLRAGRDADGPGRRADEEFATSYRKLAAESFSCRQQAEEVALSEGGAVSGYRLPRARVPSAQGRCGSAVAACSEEAALRHAERIARARQEGSDELKDSLAGAIERVTMMVPQTGHFLMEFLQNGDDAGSRSVLAELTPDAVRIANNGTPFTEADVES